MEEAQLGLSDHLSQLRRRLGNNIVNMLIRHHGGIEGELADGLRSKVTELLAWTPDVPAFRWPNDDIQPLQFNQLVTNNLPPHLVALGIGVRSCAPTTDSDLLLQDLLELGHLLYPALLLQSEPRREKDERPSPIRARTLNATTRVDEQLRAEGLFPERVGRQAFQGNSTFNEYRNLEYLYEPSELLVHAAWELCLLRGEMSQRALGLAICENLARLRTANAGDDAVAPVFLGFAGVDVSEPFEADGVYVRPYSDAAHSSLLDLGQRLERFQATGIVVEVMRPWKYALARVDEEAPAQVDAFDWEEIQRFGEILVAGHLLASAPNQVKPHELTTLRELPPPPVLRWAYCADPINRMKSHHFSTEWPIRSATSKRNFDHASLQNAMSLCSVENPSFQIATRRIAAALKPHRRWSDSLVDAVIGWEALSGDCKGDVSFRVCSIIAHLISAPGHRREVRTILQKVYSARSRVVHAGELLRSSQPSAAASIAGLVALRSLNENSALLHESDRFTALCMHK